MEEPEEQAVKPKEESLREKNRRASVTSALTGGWEEVIELGQQGSLVTWARGRRTGYCLTGAKGAFVLRK